MIIGDPKNISVLINDEQIAQLKLKSGEIETFLGAKDSFTFSCERCTVCCRDRENSPIILSPYDAYRIEQRLQMQPSEWVEKYSTKILGSESELPLLLLKYRPDEEGGNKCPFVERDGCSIYDDRPTVCRLYPLGRIVDRDLKSYFFKIKTASHCSPNNKKRQTLEDWLAKVEAEPYLDWNDKFNSLFWDMDFEKYRHSHSALKSALGTILYEFDRIESLVADPEPLSGCFQGPDSLLRASYLMAQKLIEQCFK